MRYLRLLILFLPIASFGQFGGFRTDQPFLAKDRSSAPSLTDVPGLAYWWHAGDLANGPVSTWTDKIQGVQFSQSTAANQPIAVDGELVFNGVKHMSLSSAITVGVSGADAGAWATNAYYFFGYSPIGGFLVDVGSSVSMMDSAGGIFLQETLNTSQAGKWTYFSGDIQAIDTGNNFELVFGGAGALTWTNGIKAANLYPINTSENLSFKYIGKDATETKCFVGKIRDIAIWTNVITDSSISNAIHSFSTNSCPSGADSRLVQLSADYGAADSGGSPAADGSKIAFWTNAAGYGDFTQSTAANQGYYVASGGPNGKPFIRFPSTNSISASGMTGCTQVSHFDFEQPQVIFMVVRLHPQTGIATIWDSNNDSQRNTISYYADSKYFELYAGSQLAGPATIVTNTWYILTASLNGSSSLMRTNGVLYKSGNAGTMCNYDGFNLNKACTAGNYAGKNNDLAEVRVYAHGLSSNQIYSVESTLATKYGITIP